MSRNAADQTVRSLQAFFRADLNELLAQGAPAPPPLELFQSVVREVPAYAKFLASRGVDVSTVVDLASFARLPRTSKADYCRAFPLRELCRGGTLDGADFASASSGSTGEPTLWPRALRDELGTAVRFEQVLRDGMRAHERRTLGVVCFALGSWVGGMFTSSACRLVAAKGYPLTLVTPGNNKPEILRLIAALGGDFEQVVLFGYPPFLKDVIDAGIAAGIGWQQYRLGLVTAGEVFSEEWRELVSQRAGIDDAVCRTASLYGTADGGVLANETPLSVSIRRALSRRPELARELFGEARLPTLAQYDPRHRYFEQLGDQLVFSGDGGVPLIRYDILDRGGLIPYAQMLTWLERAGVDPLAELARAGVTTRALPFVFVFGRSSLALSFYGANVYPENVAAGVEQPDLIGQLTGKFVMQVLEGADRDALLEVTVELAAGASATGELERALAVSIRAQIERLNSEFLHYAPAERRTPRVRLLPFAQPEYFPLGVKHRYTR